MNDFKNPEVEISDLKSLNEQDLLDQTKNLIQIERSTTLQILEYLHEIERRGIPQRRGFGSTHNFVVQVLGYSSAAAYRRIQSMRAMVEVPEIKPAIESGELNLTQIAMVQTTFRKESKKARPAERAEMAEEKKSVLLDSIRKSTRETERVLRARFPEATSLTETQRPVSATQSELKIMLGEEALQNLETLKLKLAHQLKEHSNIVHEETPRRSSKNARVEPMRMTEKPVSSPSSTQGTRNSGAEVVPSAGVDPQTAPPVRVLGPPNTETLQLEIRIANRSSQTT